MWRGAWTAGALPGSLAGRSFLSAGGALLLLHRPQCIGACADGDAGAAFPLLKVNPGLKLLRCAAFAGAGTAGAHSVAAAGVLVFAASALTAAGGTPARLSVAAGAPAAFLLLSGIALLWEYASAPGGVANVPFLVFVLRAPAQTVAARLVMARWARWLPVFPQPVHPVPELLDALRRARVPEVVGDLAVLIYRYIFILFATVPQHGRRRQPPGLCRAKVRLRTTGRYTAGCWRTVSGGQAL